MRHGSDTMNDLSSYAALDPSAFRKVLGTFATGVTVITTVNRAGVPLGLTANSFTSVSLTPPLVLVCLDRGSNSLAALRESRIFAVNILGEDQKPLSNMFASKAADKFSQFDWVTAGTGAPVFPGALGWVDCTVHDIIPAGDHDIVIGQVQNFGESSARPLGYFRGRYTFVSLEQEVLENAGAAIFGAIVEYEGRVLLQKVSAAVWSFPEAVSASTSLPLGGLCKKLAEVGAPTELNFLYSVSQLPARPCMSIIYRGQLVAAPQLNDPANWVFMAEEFVPWENLASYEMEMTLRRYFRESTQNRFGLFAETGTGGRLISVDKNPSDYSREDAERSLR